MEILKEIDELCEGQFWKKFLAIGLTDELRLE